MWSIFTYAWYLQRSITMNRFTKSLLKLKIRIWFDTKFEKSNWNLIKLTSLVVVVLPTKIRVAILASLAFEGRSTASTMKCLLAGFFKRQGVRSKEIHRRIGWKTVHNYSTWKHFCFLSKLKWAFSMKKIQNRPNICWKCQNSDKRIYVCTSG